MDIKMVFSSDGIGETCTGHNVSISPLLKKYIFSVRVCKEGVVVREPAF